MPDKDDPFAAVDNDTSVRTVLKPMPGGRSGTTHVSFNAVPERNRVVPEAGPASPAPWPLSPGGGLNPVERAASSLIALLGRLSSTNRHPDPEGLRVRVIQEIKGFETNARMAGVSPENIFVGRYVLCTAIDEAVLNTPWGSKSGWAGQSLLVTFHKEVSGGMRFFQLLSHMSQDPSANLDLLELMYICLALGFQGKYRLTDNGLTRLEEIKDQLYRTIRQQRGDIERSLSPHWEGVKKAATTLLPYVPVWVFGAGLGVLLLLAYAVFSFTLNSDAGPAIEKLAAINVAKLPQRVVSPSRKRVSPPPAPRESLATVLASDIKAGLITLDEDAYRSLIVVQGDGLFASGQAKVRAEYVGVLKRIAHALQKFPGRVLVTGHTDNIPIRTLRFPSNWHLSRARAQAVLNILAAEAGPSDRYEAEGRGDREPLVANDTPANRALNRRVEISLLRFSGQEPTQ
jgi:type VI secretion system protein ImpK